MEIHALLGRLTIGGESEFRIVNQSGRDTNDTVGLLLYKGGTVCRRGFDKTAAQAICSSLGYNATNPVWRTGDKWAYGQKRYKIAVTDVSCWKSSLSSCSFRMNYDSTFYADCGHDEDIFLLCASAKSGAVFILSSV